MYQFAVPRYSYFGERNTVLQEVTELLADAFRRKRTLRFMEFRSQEQMLTRVLRSLHARRSHKRWSRLRALGMRIGNDVWLPSSTSIDVPHCHLISIADHCGFGIECVLLAHDAQMDEFLDAARLGRIVIHESCHIGARTVILPGVEIGPRTIVGANSTVSRSLPPETVCTGSPAKVICSLDEYLEKHRSSMRERPHFDYDRYGSLSVNSEQRREMVEASRDGDIYMIGGRSAELRGRGGTLRTRSC